MSLMNCPKCGKPISDTLKKGIYCKYDLQQHRIKEFEKTLKPYNDLSKLEQKDYETEFCNKNEQYIQYFKNRYLDKSISKIAAIIFIAISIVLTLIKFLANIDNNTFLIILTVVNVVTICYLILYSVRKTLLYRKKIKWVIVMKKYSIWLRDNKKVLFKVSFKENEDYSFWSGSPNCNGNVGDV